MAILCLPVLSAQASPTSDALVIGIQSSKTTSLNPLFPVERDMLSIFDLMYDSLITIDDNYQPQAGLAESWTHIISRKEWYACMDEAAELVDFSQMPDIQGYDIDDEMVRIARENAKLAGVEQYIHFQRRGIEALSHPKKYGFIITNPPYGERLEDKNTIASIYRTLGERYRQLDSWSLYMITSYEDAQQMIGRKADKNRKIYNGMLKTYYYQFMGLKPGSRS